MRENTSTPTPPEQPKNELPTSELIDLIVQRYKEKNPIEINPRRAISIIRETVARMDSRLRTRVLEEIKEFTGSAIPVQVLLAEIDRVVTNFLVTSAPDASGRVKMGKPYYSPDEITEQVNKGLARLLTDIDLSKGIPEPAPVTSPPTKFQIKLNPKLSILVSALVHG